MAISVVERDRSAKPFPNLDGCTGPPEGPPVAQRSRAATITATTMIKRGEATASLRRNARSWAAPFASQAAQLEGLGDSARAAQLWSSAARLSDNELKHQDKALFAYQRVCDLGATDEALDALTRIRTARGEHAQAVPWLVRRQL